MDRIDRNAPPDNNAVKIEVLRNILIKGRNSKMTNNLFFLYVTTSKIRSTNNMSRLARMQPNIPAAAMPSVAQKLALAFNLGSQKAPPITTLFAMLQ